VQSPDGRPRSRGGGRPEAAALWASPLASLDNAAAQSAAAVDVEFAHYELRIDGAEEDDGARATPGGRRRSEGRAAAAVSVAAAVAVVARREAPLALLPGVAVAAEGWRAGLDLLYHAPYIRPSREALDRAASGIEGRWAWVGGVRPPPPHESETEEEDASVSGSVSAAAEAATLAEVRRDVLQTLEGRGVVVLHGADHDLRSLGLEALLLPPPPPLPWTAARSSPRALVVADTSALPPLTNGKSGAPRSLRQLAKVFLSRDIQEPRHRSGALHDPVEDAAAALDLWLDVAWPRVLLDRQGQEGRGGGGGGGGGGEREDAAEGVAMEAAAELVEALGATLAREVAQGRRSRRRE
jgi:hypothetical protein